MKVTIKSTSKIVTLNGVPARIWEGFTESGIKVHAFITRIAAGKDEDLSQFEAELQETFAGDRGEVSVASYPVTRRWTWALWLALGLPLVGWLALGVRAFLQAVLL